MTDSGQRRKHAREPIALLVEYEGAQELIGDFTENLSVGGTFVRTTRKLQVGEIVKLTLSFPGLLRPLRVAGVVRWVREGDGDDAGAGIQFSETPDVLKRVTDLLGRIRQGDPQLVSRVIRVLVVEDNVHVARLIREGLAGGTKRAFGGHLQFQFDNASNGREALDKLHSNPPDLLVIDVYLPVMDGPAVIRAVRSDDALRSLPIIAVSAGGSAAREEALKAGADFFLDKPMRLRQIIDSMRKLMPVT
jgi:uncharacterized protein (TIGR02266 family)